MKTSLTQSNHLREIKYRNWNKANSSKKTVKTGLFGYNSVRELNTKNMGNSPIFLSVTHTILSAKWFRSYRILKIDFAADFCFWAEQRLNGT
jgi:SRSO17 transposase